MKVTRVSNWSGKERTLDLDVTDEELAAYNAGELVQRAFPRLTEDEREFVLTGMTHDEWEEMIDAMESDETDEEKSDAF